MLAVRAPVVTESMGRALVDITLIPWRLVEDFTVLAEYLDFFPLLWLPQNLHTLRLPVII